MKKIHIFFVIFFVLFLAFGLILFYKSIKEIKEMEKETSFKPPSVEEKSKEEYKEKVEFQFKNLKGETFTLNDFKGKIVFLTFWATWCGFCARELPSIQKIYEEYKNKGIEFITVSPEDPSKVERYIKYYNYTFPAYIQTSSTPPDFRTQGIPSNFILDREGKIILKKEGFFDWASPEGKNFLDSLL